jgi:hypothetical protein
MRVRLWMWQKVQGRQRTKNTIFSLGRLPWTTGCTHLARVVVIIKADDETNQLSDRRIVLQYIGHGKNAHIALCIVALLEFFLWGCWRGSKRVRSAMEIARQTLCRSIAENPTAFVDYSAEKCGLFPMCHIVRTKEDGISSLMSRHCHTLPQSGSDCVSYRSIVPSKQVG